MTPFYFFTLFLNCQYPPHCPPSGTCPTQLREPKGPARLPRGSPSTGAEIQDWLPGRPGGGCRSEVGKGGSGPHDRTFRGPNWKSPG